MIHKTTRSILSVLLAVLLLVTSVPLTPAFAGDGGSVSLPSESGEGRALEKDDAGVYQIGSAEELQEFAKLVNDDGETTASAVLTADIDLNNQPWYPIGDKEYSPYTGTFNGDGHTISGLNINNDYRGLFGFVGTDDDNIGTVKNLTVSGTVSGYGDVGCIVIKNSGRVENCAFSGSVSVSGPDSGRIYVGGVVGKNNGTVTNCYNTGNVSVTSSDISNVGGVVGYNVGRVENCYNTGNVSVTSSDISNVGGVVGTNDAGASVENCYNTGSVSGSYVGGVVGYNIGIGNVTGCYFLQTDELNKDLQGIGNDSATGATAAAVKDLSELCDKFKDTDTWSIHPVLGRPVLNKNWEGGNGSPESPYEISTATQLKNFAVAVNDGETTASAVLTANIDLSPNMEISEDGTVTNGDKLSEWTPIGNNSRPYRGTFDGANYTISGLNINNSSANYQGLFGYVDTGGTVKNLTVSGSVSGHNFVGGVVGVNSGSVTNCAFSGNVEDCDFTGNVSGSDYVGGVVGDNRGSVENCYNTGKVSGNRSVGGVVGDNGGSVTNCYNTGTVTGADDYVGGVVGDNNSTVKNCYNTGAVTGNSYVGGVVGDNSGSVTNCYNTDSGTVKGNNYVGGVVGNSSGGFSASASVTNCYNTGSVSGSYVGGVVGQNSISSTVENCYNTGNVSGNNYVGGVVGYNSSSTVENCYNIGEVSGLDSGNYVGGVVGYNISSTVENCYNIGEVSGNSYVGGVVGYNISSTVENCYFLKTADVNVGRPGIGKGSGDATEKDDTAFHSGEVAWLLQNGQTAGEEDPIPQVWGQSNLTATTSLPTLVALNPDAAKEVYQLTFDWHYEGAPEGTTTTTNVYTNGSVAIPEINHDRAGYHISSWKDASGAPVTTETAVTADTTYTAEWTANTYTITVTAGSGGAVSGSGEYSEGTQVTVTATPATGYHFVNWTENGTEVSTSATYSFIATANRTLTANFAADAVEPTPTPTPTPDPTPTGPSTGDSTGWDDILDELENTAKGDEITIDMGDETKVPAEIFETLAGQDITLEIALEGGVTWSVNGQDIPADANLSDLDLGVEMNSDGIPVDVVNAITGERDTVQMTLAHDGDFGFTMTLTAPLGVENSGYWANLYHYDEADDQLTFETAAEIDADGNAALPLSHASQYAIVIDDHSHAIIDLPFSDVSAGDWFYDPVCYAYAGGLMTGVSATEFAPEQTTTRAMIVSILARLEGVESAQAAGFADVDDEWYATAVNWAANVGVVNGYEDNTFKPNTAITREQLAAILMNYAAYKGEDVSNRADLTSYTDQPSTWAEEAISWSVAEGLLTGVTADTLQPQGAATRAQVAAILQRFLSE